VFLNTPLVVEKEKHLNVLHVKQLDLCFTNETSQRSTNVRGGQTNSICHRLSSIMPFNHFVHVEMRNTAFIKPCFNLGAGCLVGYLSLNPFLDFFDRQFRAGQNEIDNRAGRDNAENADERKENCDAFARTNRCVCWREPNRRVTCPDRVVVVRVHNEPPGDQAASVFASRWHSKLIDLPSAVKHWVDATGRVRGQAERVFAFFSFPGSAWERTTHEVLPR
jgi:hypothetical protein